MFSLVKKLVKKLIAQNLKSILAILLLLVGIAIAYDTFLAEDAIVQMVAKSELDKTDLNALAQFIVDFQMKINLFYTELTSIVLAVGSWGTNWS